MCNMFTFLTRWSVTLLPPFAELSIEISSMAFMFSSSCINPVVELLTPSLSFSLSLRCDSDTQDASGGDQPRWVLCLLDGSRGHSGLFSPLVDILICTSNTSVLTCVVAPTQWCQITLPWPRYATKVYCCKPLAKINPHVTDVQHTDTNSHMLTGMLMRMSMRISDISWRHP